MNFMAGDKVRVVDSAGTTLNNGEEYTVVAAQIGYDTVPPLQEIVYMKDEDVHLEFAVLARRLEKIKVTELI